MKPQRVFELARELGTNKHKLVTEINRLALGFEVDNPMSMLGAGEVAKIKRILGVVEERVLGVWRLESLTSAGHDVTTGKTHLVICDDKLWEVWPDSVYYQDEPGPERAYDLEWVRELGRSYDAADFASVRSEAEFEARAEELAESDGLATRVELLELTVEHDDRPNLCALMRLTDDEMRLRWGPIAGHFPEGMDEEPGTVLAVYRREDDLEVVSRLKTPPPKVSRPTRTHPQLGKLSYDGSLGGWATERDVAGQDVTHFIYGLIDISQERLDHAAELFTAIDWGGIETYAATELVQLHNENWRQEGDVEIDAQAFAERLTPTSFVLHEDDSALAYFDDGELFYGHIIVVTLDDSLTPHRASFQG